MKLSYLRSVVTTIGICMLAYTALSVPPQSGIQSVLLGAEGCSTVPIPRRCQIVQEEQATAPGRPAALSR